ncbi:MAG: xylulokinase [Rhodospirillaceae bacterium]|nr:xylulokinase [Rhodospirillaceae bacterium]
MYLGIDIGTSGVKAVVVDDAGEVVDQGSAHLKVDRPYPQWAEQNPDDWWRGAEAAVADIKARSPQALAAVRGAGLSGQQHSTTLLDEAERPLRPAILWNDGRSGPHCQQLERIAPGLRPITGNQAMPGFTAPKLLWVAEHEPENFAKTRRILLPKDYVRLQMTGEAVSDMSDSAGTLWLDVANRRWSGELLAACGLSEAQMPRLVEGSEVSATLKDDVADRWGVPRGTPVAGGGGDNACGAVGVGVVSTGRAFLSIGTSGVLFTATPTFAPNPGGGMHAFCHALPGMWHQMSVIMSAALCLDWVVKLTGADGVTALLAEAEAADARGLKDVPVFLPYLMGDRTPHNDPLATGVFYGLTPDTDRAALALSVLEGVTFAFVDGMEALTDAGTVIETVSVIGGGARSAFWGRMLASVLGLHLDYHDGGEVGPAYGAARLARMAATGEAPDVVATRPKVARTIHPDPAVAERLAPRLARFRSLYPVLSPVFHAAE